jgi:hypothetical protein
MRDSLKIILVVFACALGLPLQSRCQEKWSSEEAIQKIREAETRALAVEVKSFSGRGFRRNATGAYEPTGKRIDGSSVRDGMFGGRYVLQRVETFPLDSADGGEFITRESLESYDGREGRSLRPAMKLANGRERKAQVEITAESPNSSLAAFASLCDGSAASLGSFQSYIKVEGSRTLLLGDSLAAMVEQGKEVKISEEFVGSVRLLKIDDPFGNTYLFDPARGFCLVQAISVDRTLRPSQGFMKLYVSRFERIGVDSWYPVEGQWEESAVEAPGSLDRVAFSVRGVSELRDADYKYKVALPEGTIVHDLVSNKVYASTGTSESLQKHLVEVATRAQSETGKLEPSTSSASEDVVQESTATNWYWVLGSLFVLCLVAVCILIRRRARLSVCLAFALTGLSANAGKARAIDSYSETQFNCAVNTAYVALTLFEKKVNLDELADVMKAGPALANECSMLDLKRAFISFGLGLDAVRVPDVSSYLGQLPENRIAVVRLPAGAPTASHFVLVVRGRQTSFVVVDPFAAQEIKVGPIGGPALQLLDQPGEMLVIHMPPLKSGKHPVLLNSQMELGSLSKAQDPVACRFRVFNSGDKAVTLKEVKTSCGCASPVAFDPVIEPGQTSIVTLTLNPAALPAGVGNREAVFVTDAEGGGAIVARMSFDVRDDTAARTTGALALVPSRLTFGKLPTAKAVAATHDVTLSLPMDARQYGESVQVYVDSDASLVRIEKRAMHVGQAGSIDMHYTIALANTPPLGRFKSSITFRVWNQVKASFDTAELHVSGLVE